MALTLAKMRRDYWARFERFVKQLAKQCEALYVVTGPLFLPSRMAEGTFAMSYPLIGAPSYRLCKTDPATLVAWTHYSSPIA